MGKISTIVGKKKMLVSFIIIILLVSSFVFIVGRGSSNTSAAAVKDLGLSATVYKSLSCGCCSIFTQYLKKYSVATTVIQKDNMDEIKNQFKIPSDMESCHTTVMGNYFVEGHVPIEAMVKLMREKPNIAGIALPGMPTGSPGMSGAKQGDFVIYAIAKDGGVSEFMII